MWTASATPDTERTRYLSAEYHDLEMGLTSVEPGSMDSEAFKRAPEASWISLILAPPLPILFISLWSQRHEKKAYTLPMREFGMIYLMVTARDPGTEAISNGSSMIRRTIRPNA